jgi:hypothetical protein
MTQPDEELLADVLIHAVVLIIIITVVAWPLKQLWNGFAPDVLGLHEATYLNGLSFLGFLVTAGLSPFKVK